MLKRFFYYTLICVTAFFLFHEIHSFLISYNEIQHPFEIRRIYLFQALFTLFLCVLFEIIALKIPKMHDQLGFLYLGSMVFKITVFCVVFNELLFSSLVLSKADSLSMLIPIFIFLLIEVSIIVKIINRNI
ncbi:DUF6168 family protein [Patiriisocius marinistellae]|uniref:DUF6168 family protein n=1 Tax=Patiriisocius marinistellae TaxID=2494560 RepID=UPI0035312602